jgi:hypothetical protein
MKFTKPILIVLIIFSFLITNLEGKELSEIFKDAQSEQFLDTFNYQLFLSEIKPNNVIELERTRSYLYDLGIDGDAFIYKSFEVYSALQIIDFQEDMESIKSFLELGVVMANSKYYLADSIFIYTAVSDLIFEKIAKPLDLAIAEGAIKTNNFDIKYIANRLCDNQYCIDMPTSNWTKLRQNIAKGDWNYIWTKCTGTYLMEFLMAIGFGLLGLILIIWLIRKKRK